MLGTSTPEDVMIISLSSRTQQVLAVDFSGLDTKLVTAMERNKLAELVFNRMFGMA